MVLKEYIFDGLMYKILPGLLAVSALLIVSAKCEAYDRMSDTEATKWEIRQTQPAFTERVVDFKSKDVSAFSREYVSRHEVYDTGRYLSYRRHYADRRMLRALREAQSLGGNYYGSRSLYTM